MEPSIQPRTHDTSSTRYHIDNLKGFFKTLIEAALAAFPNRGRTHYAAVCVLLLSWENDTLGVIDELLELQAVFQTFYSFYTEEWKIPSNGSHNWLFFLLAQFLQHYGSEGNLLIIYYRGHSYMNDHGQCVWACSAEDGTPKVQWYALQTSLEQAQSDGLLLLDCCAAASSAAESGSGTGVTEVIAACGFESDAPLVGQDSFTRILIDELIHLSFGPSFSAALLHHKLLGRVKQFNPRSASEEDYELTRIPVHIILANEAKRRSIELTPKIIRKSRTASDGLQASTSIQTSSLSSEPSEQVEKQSLESIKSLFRGTRNEIESAFPKVLISIALERDQEFDSVELTEWLKSVPPLANAVTVEAVYPGYSILLLLSLPVAVWDMLPENRAVTFIGFIGSTNVVSTLEKPTCAISPAQASSDQ